MNILISLDFTLYKIVSRNWPTAFIQEVNSLDGVIRNIFFKKYELLILDVDMPGNEKLDQLIAKAKEFCKVAIFSSKNNSSGIKKMMASGAHIFLPATLTEREVITLLNLH